MTSLVARLASRFARQKDTSPTSRKRRRLRSVESLEGRILLATFATNAIADPGDGVCDMAECTLREAIDAANANPGLDDILFDIPGPGLHTIQPLSALPTITDPVIIDGYTQPGASPNTLADGDDAILQIEISGASLPTSGVVYGLVIAAGNSTVRGLVINRFTPFVCCNSDAAFSGSSAIALFGAGGNIIEGNFLGTDATGTTALGNFNGVEIDQGSSGNLIGGTSPSARNILSANTIGVAIRRSGSPNAPNRVQGNFIGTTKDGTGRLGNQEGVLLTHAANNLIGGTDDGSRNVIAGSSNLASNGVHLTGDGSAGNLIVGNFIGTDVSGSANLGNRQGVWIGGGAFHNTVGGTSPNSRNIISGNYYGVALDDPGPGNLVQGNFIGTDHAGTADLGNVDGVYVNLGVGTTIGGTTPGAGNLISGNDIFGLDIHGDCIVQGNLIGTDVSGTTALGNSRGLAVAGGAAGSTVGGTADGARNIISGNIGDGITVYHSNDLVQGNFIGTDVTGSHRLENGGAGVSLWSGTIGGTSPAARNVISGNRYGVGVFSTGGIIQGNFIGTDVTGTVALGNSSAGILFAAGSGNVTIGGTAPGAGNVISGGQPYGVLLGNSNNLVQGNLIGSDFTGTVPLGNGIGILLGGSNNTVGGTTLDARNVISGNSAYGIFVPGAIKNTVQGNLIGTDVTGAVALGNGIGILLGGSENTVGGTTREARNVISGNSSGIHLYSSAATNNVILGNFIGTDVTGTARLGNGYSGVWITNGAAHNLIGGTIADARNIISGNGVAGILLEVNSGPGNRIQANFIGTDVSGTADLGNGRAGVFIDGGIGNFVGGTEPGAGNIISGNDYFGVYINAFNNLVQGNFIGTDLTGTAAIGNGDRGVAIAGSGNIVGGTEPGARNIISGNAFEGISAVGENSLVQGNFIGTDVTGTVAVGNGRAGVSLSGNVLIGGTTATARNVISGNGAIGVWIAGTGGLVRGNFIGTDVTGTIALGNGDDGVLVSAGTGVTIGGTDSGAGNVISGNRVSGVRLQCGPNTVVQGNLIGTDLTGTVAIGNFVGVNIQGCGQNLIGGATPAARNVISGNTAQGILINEGNSIENIVQGNFIGTDISGTRPLGNQGNGVLISCCGNASNPNDNKIGGIDPRAGNVIAFNGANGVYVQAGVGNVVRDNAIFSNGALGIELGSDGATPNDPGDSDAGANDLQNFPTVSLVVPGSVTRVVGSLNSLSNKLFTLDFYASSAADPSGFGEGERYLGFTSLVTDASGNANFDITLSAPTVVGEVITATATDPAGSTSEFSGAVVASNQPPTANAGGPYEISEGESLTLDASDTTDDDSTSLTYMWDVDGDGDFVENVSGEQPTLTWSQLVALGIDDGPDGRTVTVEVSDGTSVDTASATLTIGNAAPTLAFDPVVMIDENSVATLIGTIGDPGVLDTFTLEIDWGDPLSPNNLETYIFDASATGSQTFTLTHQYLDDNPTVTAQDTYTIGATVTDKDNDSGSDGETVLVKNVAPVVGPITGPSGVSVGSPAMFSAPFSDVGTLDTHTCIVSWGDSTSSVGTVSESGGSGTCSATHSYTNSGSFTVTFTVTDDDSGGDSESLVLSNVARSAFILNPTLCGSLTATGNAQTAFQGPITVASNCATSAISASGNAHISASRVDVVGGWRTTGNATIAPTPTQIPGPVADPLASLAAPGGGPLRAQVNCSGNSVQTIDPGVYSRIQASGNCQLTMTAGEYIVAGGGYQVSGNASVTGSQVTIYNAGSSFPDPGGSFTSIQISGNGVINLSPPIAGPLNGILIFQARDNSRSMSLSGNANGMTGTIYARAAQLSLSGNGVLRASLVVDNLRLSGNAAASLTAGSGSGDAEAAILAAGQLRTGVLWVSIRSDTGAITPDQLARVRDAIATVNGTFGPYGVSLVEVDAVSSTFADIRIQISSTSACGSAADGVLGCSTIFGDITFLEGWNWYSGADPATVGGNQYDLQTIATHELGHAIGVEHSPDARSAMYAALSTGMTRRSFTSQDLEALVEEYEHENPPAEALFAGDRFDGIGRQRDGERWLTGNVEIEPSRHTLMVSDRTVGTGHDDILLAGDGDDMLIGGTGRDILIGGFGASHFGKNGGDAIHIGGSSMHNSNPDALDAILTEWTSAAIYADRFDT